MFTRLHHGAESQHENVRLHSIWCEQTFVKWCRRQGSNLRPMAYESIALPLSYTGAEQSVAHTYCFVCAATRIHRYKTTEYRFSPVASTRCLKKKNPAQKAFCKGLAMHVVVNGRYAPEEGPAPWVQAVPRPDCGLRLPASTEHTSQTGDGDRWGRGPYW